MLGLFGKKLQLRMEIDQQVVAGRPLEVRWSADGQDDKVRGGRLELSYRNRFLHQTDDSEGHSSQSKRTVTVPVQTLELFTGQPPAGEQRATLELPPTPATAPKGVEWHVQLVMDRPGRDVSVERVIDVLAPADGLEQWSSAPATSSGAECSIDMRVEPRTYRPGEVVRGTVDIRPTASVSARGIRVDLVRRRNEQDGIVKTESTSVELASKMELSPTQPLQYNFEIAVPADASPSFKAERNSQYWLVQCVVDRRMKTDFVGAVEIVVHNAP